MASLIACLGIAAGSASLKICGGYCAGLGRAPICGVRGRGGASKFQDFPLVASLGATGKGSWAGRLVAGTSFDRPSTTGGKLRFLMGWIWAVAALWSPRHAVTRTNQPFLGLVHKLGRLIAMPRLDQIAGQGGGFRRIEGGTPPMPAPPPPSMHPHAVFRISVPDFPREAIPSLTTGPWLMCKAGQGREGQSVCNGSGVRDATRDGMGSARGAESGAVCAGEGQRGGSVRLVAGKAGTLGGGMNHVNR